MDGTALQAHQNEANGAERGELAPEFSAHMCALALDVAHLALNECPTLAQVFAGTILQQAFVVEYVIENFTCENCHRVAAKDTWQSVVQLRQKVRTFGSVLVSRAFGTSAHSDSATTLPGGPQTDVLLPRAADFKAQRARAGKAETLIHTQFTSALHSLSLKKILM